MRAGTIIVITSFPDMANVLILAENLRTKTTFHDDDFPRESLPEKVKDLLENL